ncbi:hypothetical protein EZS27_020093 [termite gut metagenome]|uniref:Uncharacterized protein n=1 Tax=termite gut metagenome TaxID=433724 RepID=A0A5J4RCV0_9ZZZZ
MGDTFQSKNSDLSLGSVFSIFEMGQSDNDYEAENFAKETSLYLSRMVLL